MLTLNTEPGPRIVSREEWRAARLDLLAKEKEATRARDALNAERRKLPLVEIDKEYFFECPDGDRLSLRDLFDEHRQLIVYHFMFDPADDEGCSGCSHLADNVGHLAHLHARDTSLVFVSRAPVAKILPFRERMGWTVPWVSSFGSDFNYDFHVTLDESVAPIEYNYRDADALRAAGEEYHLKEEQPGLSVFVRDGDRVFHSYSAYGRGLDAILSTYQLLDLTPGGRMEGWDGMPDLNGEGMGWLRHHDRYDGAAAVQRAGVGAAWAGEGESCCGS